MQNSVLVDAFLAHEKELLNFLSKRLGSRSLAADLTQDLYVKICKMNELGQVRDGRAYLFGMAANLATDYLRVERRRAQIRSEADGTVWARHEELTPERQVMDRAELHFMEQEIAKLSPRCRRVFYLSRFEGWSQADIAQELGVGVTTVYKELKKAMSAMRDARRRFRGDQMTENPLPNVDRGEKE